MTPHRHSKHVALFGGSFNPPHLGHVEICRYLLNEKGIDAVWLIPCWRHPFGKALAPFKDRITMCNFAVQEFGPKVSVIDIESKLGGVSHTVTTIEHIKRIHPYFNFSFVVGEDTIEESNAWKDFDRIRELTNIVTIPRGQASPIPDISSSEIRRRIKEGITFSNLVPTEVAVYIITHGMYRE